MLHKHGTRSFRVALVSAMLMSFFWIRTQSVAAVGPTELFFSEYIEGSSNNKALEIYNGTGAVVDLGAGGYNVQMYFNGSTSATLTINLAGTVVNNDVFVIAHSSGNASILAQADQTNGSGWFNGNDAVVLRKGTVIIDSIGQIGFDPGTEWGSGLTSTADNTLRRKSSVSEGDTNIGNAFDPDVEWNGFARDTFDGLGSHSAGPSASPSASASPSPSPSPSSEPNVCGQSFTPIYAIQGSGASTAVTGDVTTQGVVVGDFDNPDGLSGFYLQSLEDDANPATSDGIFVYTGSANRVTAGQVVRVTGFARERFNQTTINGSNSNNAAVPAANIVDCGTATLPAPAEVTMPFASTTFLEQFEGMLVRLPQALVISEYFDYERYGEMVLALPLDGESRPFTPTSIDEPGAPAQARAQANNLRRITIDDGLGIQNPAVVRHPNSEPFSLNNRFRGGDTVQNTIGVLGFDFSRYRIQPTEPANYTAVNARTVAPEPVGGRLRVAAMNTLNFFLTPDYPTGDSLDNKCGPVRNMECRGADADQSQEFTRQRNKLLAALSGLKADIIGLNELENTTGVDPLGDPTNGVVVGLNAMPGVGTYDYIDTGVIGTDAIRVGLIYKPAVVKPVGDFKLLNAAVDPRFIDTKSRPALAQTFEEIATGARFTVVVNHLKSKGSDCNDVGDPDTGDGQGNCNITRTKAAEALVDWLATDPTGSADPDFLIIGDLNSYAKEDPIDAIQAGADDKAGTSDDYTNLIAKYQGTYAYSYVFDGQAGYLDHALANASLVSQVTGAADWHINADEPDLLDYDTSFKPVQQDAIYEPNAYRSSDHDPVVVGLNLAPCLCSTKVEVTDRTTSVHGEVKVSYGDGKVASSVTVTVEWTTPTGTFTQTGRTNRKGNVEFSVARNAGDYNLRVVNITDVPAGTAMFCPWRGITQDSLTIPGL